MNIMNIIKPPWNLVGDGYVFLTKSGVVMLVDYKTSNIGSYYELLFIKTIDGHRSINEIYVSTQSSVVNGERNWAIPKQLANFKREIKNDLDHWIIKKGNKVILDIILKGQKISFPITTAIIPNTITQPSFSNHNIYLITKPIAKGKGRFAKIVSKLYNKFDDISNDFPNPIITIKIDNFKMIFPEAITYEV